MFAGSAIVAIILDANTAKQSCFEGVVLCLRTVIPALFPFFLLSGIINACFLGTRTRFLQPLKRLCNISDGCESLFLVGMLAGYPIGAQLINQAYQDKAISKPVAQRMLGFCNNAGPAFIFGMLSQLFQQPAVPWFIWSVHIVSAMLVATTLPRVDHIVCTISKVTPPTLPTAMKNAIANIAYVCGWVITFKILLGFCDKWFLWRLTPTIRIVIAGILELSNGCILLKNISAVGLRFLLVNVFLSFGGICVGMQTRSAVHGLGMGQYFPGKILQALFSALISLQLQRFLFPSSQALNAPNSIYLLLIAGIALVLCFFYRKKVVAFPKKMLYNTGKSIHKEPQYAISQKNNTFL